MKGVERNRKDDGRKKGGLKVHMLTDIHSDSAKFVKISEAKSHDKNFLQDLVLPFRKRKRHKDADLGDMDSTLAAYGFKTAIK